MQTQDGVLKYDDRLPLRDLRGLLAHQDVAESVDPARVRLEMIVHLDPMPGIAVDADHLQIQALDLGRPSGLDQDVGAGNLAGRARGRVAEDAGFLPGSDRDLRQLDVVVNGESLGLQKLGQAFRGFGILLGQDSGRIGQDRHLRAEPREALGELDRRWPGTKDGQALWQLSQRPEARVIEVPRFGQARDLGDGRPRAGGDHEPLPGDRRGSVDPDRVIRLECRRTMVDVDPFGTQGVVRIVAGDFLDHGADAVHHGGEIDLDRSRFQSERSGRAELTDELCRLHQPFARHAGPESSLASQSLLLDQCHPGADSCRRQRNAQSARAPADHHQVVHRRLSIARKEKGSPHPRRPRPEAEGIP